MINVIIPSYKRSHDLKGKDYFAMAKYCIPESQKDEYLKVLPEDRIILLPDNQDGSITRKRNWILKNIPRPLIMIDDDVEKMMYWDNRKEGYLKTEFPQILLNELFDSFVDLAEQFEVKLFGVAQNGDDRTYKENIPFNLTNIVLGPFQGHLEHDLKFDDNVGSKDDYDMSLQQLRKYSKILRINKYCYICEHGDNKGGIVSYRTKEKEIEYCKNIMLKWGKKIISYKLPPKKMVDLLNASKVNIPIKGV